MHSNRKVLAVLVLLAGSCLSGIAQLAAPPSAHGGNPNRTIDLRDPQAGTLQKVPRYVFDKQNPRHRSMAPQTRSCYTEQVEAEQQAFAPGATEADSTFEQWMQTTIREQQRTRSLFRFGPEEILSIPTVVHVIYANSLENISDAQVYSQIQALNQDYRRQNPDQAMTAREFKNLAVDTGIEFCLANMDPQGRPTNGIHRVSFSGAPFNERYLNDVIKPATIWDPNRYFNIWVCHLSDNVLGFATFPVSSGLTGVPAQQGTAKTDGVVIHYSVFGTTGAVTAPFNKGRTATHEVGHWLGLRHIWGDGPCGVDDFCRDTPDSDGPHYGCATNSAACGGGNAMVQNYMDYTDDGCMNLFTADQKARMRLVLQNSPRRGSLLSAGTCIPPLTAPEPAFISSITQGCAPLEVTFTDQSKGKQLTWQWTFPGGRPSSSTQQNPVVQYRQAGVYPVSLVVTNPAGSRSVTRERVVTVTGAGVALPYVVDFEANTGATAFTIHNPDQDYTWGLTERLGGQGKSARSLSINNFDNKLVNSADWVLLPVMDFSEEIAPEMSFDLAYGPYGPSFSDTLGVFVSTGCGTLFRSVYYKGGRQLSTVCDRQVAAPFTPGSQEWRNERIDLRALAGQPNVQIAFINFSGNGNDILIDNIRIGAPLPPPPTPQLPATVREVCAGEQLSLTQQSTGEITSWLWSFPGGTPASSQDPSPKVSYSLPGKYDVILTVRGPGGERSMTRTQWVQVNAAPSLRLEGGSELCEGETLELKASGANSYTWRLGSQLLSSGQQSTVAISPRADETLTLTGTTGACESKLVTPIRVRAARPLAVVPASAELCEGQAVTLQATGALQYLWSPAPAEGSTNSGSLTVAPVNTTTYLVSGVNELGCRLSAKVTVTVRKAPAALSAVASSQRICPGGVVRLQGTGADSYRWSPTTGLSQGTGSEVIATPTASTTYRLEGVNSFGCSAFREVRIDVGTFPVVQIRSLQPEICQGREATLQVRGALRYDWFPREQIIGNGSEVLALPREDQIFTVIGSNESGCSDTAQVLVKVKKPLPLEVKATEPVICAGSSTMLVAQGATQYEWQAQGSFAGSRGDRVTVSPFRTETYKVLGIDPGGCQSSATVTVQVAQSARARADFRADKTITCAGQEVTFSSLSSNGIRYRWQFEGGEPAISFDPNPKVRFYQQGSYNVSLEVMGCDGTWDRFEQSDYLFITPSAQLTLNELDQVICRGEQLTLVANGGSNYAWSPADGLDRTSGASVLAQPLATTTYTVRSVDNDGCVSSQRVTLEVVNASELSITPAVARICQGDSVLLQASGALNYRWTEPGSSLGFSGNQITVKPLRSSRYQVQATDANGCRYLQEVAVEVSDSISLRLSADKTSICEGETLILTAEGASVVNWLPAGLVSSAAGLQVEAFPKESTTFRAVGVNENGCRKEATLRIEVERVVPLEIRAQDSVICPGEATLLTVSGGGSYTWSPAQALSQAIGPIVTAAPTSTTTFTATRTEGGCGAAAQFTLEVRKPASLQVTPSTASICLGDQVTLRVQGGTRYVWELAEGLNTVAGQEVTVSPRQSTAYKVSSLDENNCEVSSTATVVVREGNFVGVASSASTVCAGEEITLTASGADTYWWLPEPTLLRDSGERVYAQPVIGTTYEVVGETREGCRDTARVEVMVREFEATFTMTPEQVDLAKGPGLVKFEGELDGAAEYAWDFGGRGVSDEPNPLHVFPQPGVYRVRFAASDGICVSRSTQELVVVNSSSLADIRDEGSVQLVALGEGRFLLQFSSPREMYLRVQWMDAEGLELLSGAIRPREGMFTQEFDLSAYPAGAYFLRMSDGESTETLTVRR